MRRRPEEEKGFDLFGTNLFEAANHDQRWIITKPEEESGGQTEFPFVGTEHEAKMAAKSMCGTYRRAEDNIEEISVIDKKLKEEEKEK